MVAKRLQYQDGHHVKNDIADKKKCLKYAMKEIVHQLLNDLHQITKSD
jgi:hypothetical protein